MSKHLLFLIALVTVGTLGSFVLTPVLGLSAYYFLSVLRPQFWWGWDLPDDPGWSRFVAVATLMATALWRLGLLAPARVAAPPWYGNPRYTRSHYLFLLFVLWISVTYPTAQNTERAAPYFEEYVKIFLMFICGTLILRTAGDVRLVFTVVLVAVIYIAYEANMYFVFQNYFNVFQRYEAAGQDSNWAGLTLAMAVPMCYFAWESTRHWVRWGYLLAIPVILHAVMFSYSRGAMLSLCVTAPVIFLRSRQKRFLTVVLLCVGACIPVLAGKEIQERFFSIGKSESDESAQSRWTTWRIAIKMANERPVFGFGIRNSNLYTHAYGADIEGRSIHSQYLQTAADSGWVGAGLYVLMLGSVFVGLWHTRRTLRRWDDPETARVRSLAAGVECSLLVFCIGAVFLSLEHFEMPYVLILLGVQLHAITNAIQARYPAGPAPAATAPPASVGRTAPVAP